PAGRENGPAAWVERESREPGDDKLLVYLPRKSRRPPALLESVLRSAQARRLAARQVWDETLYARSMRDRGTELATQLALLATPRQALPLQLPLLSPDQRTGRCRARRVRD